MPGWPNRSQTIKSAWHRAGFARHDHVVSAGGGPQPAASMLVASILTVVVGFDMRTRKGRSFEAVQVTACADHGTRTMTDNRCRRNVILPNSP